MDCCWFQTSFMAILALILLLVADDASGLSCWKCSSQTDASCRDFFNTTRILLNHRRMDSFNYGSQQLARTDPYLAECEGMHTATFGHFKSVCLKRVLSVPHGPDEVIRECRMVNKDFNTGHCPEEIESNRPRNLDYCGTCEYDGCNGASVHGLTLVAGLVPVVLLLGK